MYSIERVRVAALKALPEQGISQEITTEQCMEACVRVPKIRIQVWLFAWILGNERHPTARGQGSFGLDPVLEITSSGFQ